MDKLQPFLKWAGGKRQLIPEISKYIPINFEQYFEPFVGAGAVLFNLKPHIATINDVNSELINVYNVIKDNIDELINELKVHKNDEEYFYQIRSLDRTEEFQSLSPITKASRLIYLNKTCFNGLYRVNSRGEFNVPFGRYKNPTIINEEVLRTVSSYLNSNKVSILNTDFSEAVEKAKKGDFVYFDPPYDPLNDTSSFTSYSLGGFNKGEQERLRDTFLELHNRGCYVLLSNSDTEFINDIYDYPEIKIEKVSATRNINSNASKRGKISEVLIRNYDKEN